MTKPEKLYQLLLDSTARTVSFRDFERLVLGFGFRLQRVRGSHRHYTHPSVPAVLTINPDKSTAHRYQVRLLLEFVKDCALKLDA